MDSTIYELINVRLSRNNASIAWGFTLGATRPQNQLSVTSVDLNSMAQKSGLHAGDIVEQLNGLNAQQMSLGEATRQLEHCNEVALLLKRAAPVGGHSSLVPSMEVEELLRVQGDQLLPPAFPSPQAPARLGNQVGQFRGAVEQDIARLLQQTHLQAQPEKVEHAESEWESHDDGYHRRQQRTYVMTDTSLGQHQQAPPVPPKGPAVNAAATAPQQFAPERTISNQVPSPGGLLIQTAQTEQKLPPQQAYQQQPSSQTTGSYMSSLSTTTPPSGGNEQQEVELIYPDPPRWDELIFNAEHRAFSPQQLYRRELLEHNMNKYAQSQQGTGGGLVQQRLETHSEGPYEWQKSLRQYEYCMEQRDVGDLQTAIPEGIYEEQLPHDDEGSVIVAEEGEVYADDNEEVHGGSQYQSYQSATEHVSPPPGFPQNPQYTVKTIVHQQQVPLQPQSQARPPERQQPQQPQQTRSISHQQKAPIPQTQPRYFCKGGMDRLVVTNALGGKSQEPAGLRYRHTYAPTQRSRVFTTASSQKQPRSEGGQRVFYTRYSPRTYRELSPQATIAHLQYNSPLELYSPKETAEAYPQQRGEEFQQANDPAMRMSYLDSPTRRLIAEEENSENVGGRPPSDFQFIHQQSPAMH